MYKLAIQSVAKSYSPRDQWSTIALRETDCFETMQDIYKYLRKNYGKSRRSAMYVEMKNGASRRVGWVIGFRNADWSHAPVSHWLQQDWIQLLKVEPVYLDRAE